MTDVCLVSSIAGAAPQGPGLCAEMELPCAMLVLLSPRPKPPLPCCTRPTMSRCLRSAFACCVAGLGVHFLPLASVGAVWATHGSRDSVSVISSLTLEHLNSSVRLDTGSSRVPLPYSPMLLKQRGRPNHFLANELSNLSSFSTFEVGTS